MQTFHSYLRYIHIVYTCLRNIYVCKKKDNVFWQLSFIHTYPFIHFLHIYGEFHNPPYTISEYITVLYSTVMHTQTIQHGLFSSGSSTIFRQASAASTNIGSVIAFAIAEVGSRLFTTSFIIVRTWGFARHCFNSLLSRNCSNFSMGTVSIVENKYFCLILLILLTGSWNFSKLASFFRGSQTWSLCSLQHATEQLKQIKYWYVGFRANYANLIK